jgi:hypothetical protein
VWQLSAEKPSRGRIPFLFSKGESFAVCHSELKVVASREKADPSPPFAKTGRPGSG